MVRTWQDGYRDYASMSQAQRPSSPQLPPRPVSAAATQLPRRPSSQLSGEMSPRQLSSQLSAQLSAQLPRLQPSRGSSLYGSQSEYGDISAYSSGASTPDGGSRPVTPRERVQHQIVLNQKKRLQRLQVSSNTTCWVCLTGCCGSKLIISHMHFTLIC